MMQARTSSRRRAWHDDSVDSRGPVTPGEELHSRRLTVPAFRLLNIGGEVLESVSGYHSAGQFVDLLRRNAGKSEAPGQAKVELDKSNELLEQLKKATKPKERKKAVLGVVTLLASPERRHRQKAKGALFAEGKRAWPGLLSCLSDRRLAVRAAAFDILSEASAQELPFDAFAPVAMRSAQAEAWKRRVQEVTTTESKEQ
jgi:hypothetical protein